MIVTIDGPAGAGKSTVAKRLARELGFDFLDTGAMYRCVTLACLRRKISLDDAVGVVAVARECRIELKGNKSFLDGEDVSEAIRTPSVTKAIRSIADNQQVREKLVAAQRKWTLGKDAVTEGRDQGTVAFPNAECKIFLTASPEERARRRVAQLIELGVDVSYDEVLELQNQRDAQDTQRESGGLRPALDAETLWTDGMTEDEVLRSLVQMVENKRRFKTDSTNDNQLSDESAVPQNL
ncbi:MAG: (d)CMP kinase [Pirellula sp.]